MNLDFNFTGLTKLKDWWKQVLANLDTIQKDFNQLDSNLSTEITDRQSADETLQSDIDAKAPKDHRSSSKDYGIGTNAYYGHVKLLDSVNDGNTQTQGIAATPNAVKTAYKKAVEGVNAAESVQTGLATMTEDINKLQTNSHTHSNKTILDGIDSTDIATWNGIKEQVNKTELEAAIAAEATIRINEDSKLLENIKAEATTRQDEDAQLSERLSGEATIRISEDRLLQGWINTETTNRQNEDGIIRAELNEHQDYMNDITYGVLAELQRIYTAMGVTFYDGGLFGMVQDGLPLDGGDFESEPTDIFDCGGFEPLKITISAGAVIDGGTY